MQRRSLLSVLASAGTLLAGWPAIGRCRPVPEPFRPLIAALRRRESAAVIGTTFLRQHPAEADPGHLSATITADLRARGCDPPRAGQSRVRRAIAEQMRADFARGRVIDVDGWVLSATEARLCGLAALAT